MNRALIVVDYQNDFVTGSLGFPGAEKLAGPIVERIKEYRKNGDDIIFTVDTGQLSQSHLHDSICLLRCKSLRCITSDFISIHHS